MFHNKRPKKRLLAVASGGGHWVQLMRLRPAFAHSETVYASVHPKAPLDIGDARYHSYLDANKDTKIGLLIMALQIFLLVAWYRPDRVVSTGAAGGYFACRFGRWFGAKTLFIDSIANAETLSLSARLSLPHADQVFSQWPEVSRREGGTYHGSIL